ncbi:hypothetical protein AAU61_13160 [Desulfocarbo indianensis]|nr:hypothetical protein AAU61_13160 [Desulfocarbo indianensis]
MTITPVAEPPIQEPIITKNAMLDVETSSVVSEEFARRSVGVKEKLALRQAPLPPGPEPAQAGPAVETISPPRQEAVRLDASEPFKQIVAEEARPPHYAAADNNESKRRAGGEPPVEPPRAVMGKRGQGRTERNEPQVEIRPWQRPMRDEEPLHAPHELAPPTARKAAGREARPIDRRGDEGLLDYARPRKELDAPRIEIGTVEVRISEPPKPARKARPAPPATLSRGLHIPFGVGQG